MKIQDKIIHNLEWGNKRLKEINKGLSEEQLEILEFCLLNDTKQFVIPVVSKSLMNKRFAESRERTARVREQIAIEKFIEIYYDGDDDLTFEEVNKRLKLH